MFIIFFGGGRGGPVSPHHFMTECHWHFGTPPPLPETFVISPGVKYFVLDLKTFTSVIVTYIVTQGKN